MQTVSTLESFRDHYGHLPVGDDVEIFVVSQSSPRKVLTLAALHYGDCARKRVVLVVPYDEGEDYLPIAHKYKIKRILRIKSEDLLPPSTYRSIAETAENKFLILDDSLTFYKRVYRSKALYPFKKYDMHALLVFVSRLLDDFPVVAISHYNYNNKYRFPFLLNAHTEFAVAYRKKEFLEAYNSDPNRRDEIDTTLALAQLGYANTVITEYAIASGNSPPQYFPLNHWRKAYARGCQKLFGKKL